MHKHEIFIDYAWTDFYDGTVSPNCEKTEIKFRVELSSSNAYICDCLFTNITSTSSGGAFYSISTTKLLIETTTFASCKTSAQNGGAVYFVNTNYGQSAINRVCAFDCCSTYSSGSSNGQFLYVSVKDALEYKNSVNYSSVGNCVNLNSDSCL